MTNPTAAQLAAALKTLKNMANDDVPMELIDGGARAGAPAGRVSVAPGQSISSGWGNTVWDQTTNVFASNADRDNQWPAPLDGAKCYTADTRIFWRRSTGVWLRDIPELLAVAVTTPMSGITTNQIPITGLGGNVTVASPRRVEIVSDFPISKATPDTTAQVCALIMINNGGNAFVQQLLNANTRGALHLVIRTTLIAGTHAVRVDAYTAAGFVNIPADVGTPSLLSVFDLGPV